MLSSAECLAKINEFKTIKSNVSSILSPLEECYTSAKESDKYAEKTIINGKSFDEDEIKNFMSTLSTVSSNITAIMSECDEKIAKYEVLYQQALAREREEAEKKRKMNNYY